MGTTLPTDTKLRPPAFDPGPVHATGAQYNKQRHREYRIASHTQAGPDQGPAALVKRVKHDFARDLFLSKVALTCKPFPKAGRWVYHWVFLPPGRHPYLGQYEFAREQSQSRRPGCWPFRLRIQHWQGVRIAPSRERARVVAKGAYENDRGENGSWDTVYHFIWKAAVRYKDGRWRITILSEEPLDDTGD